MMLCKQAHQALALYVVDHRVRGTDHETHVGGGAAAQQFTVIGQHAAVDRDVDALGIAGNWPVVAQLLDVGKVQAVMAGDIFRDFRLAVLADVAG